MAAILCESISKVLRGTCDAVGTVLTIPCKACGLATDQITNVCRSPFCLYLSVALGLNIPPIIFTARSYRGADCASSLNWMYLNAFLCSINIIAAIYIAAKISQGDNSDGDAPFIDAEAGSANNQTNAAAQSSSSDKPKTFVDTILENTIKTKVGGVMTDTRSKSISRVKHILCYDPWVALYIIIGVFFMVWQTMGMGRLGNCGEGDIDMYLSHSLICGFMFISCGGMAFGCSLCCLVR